MRFVPGGFVAADSMALYHQLVDRNHRLEQLIELEAPPIVVRNEGRIQRDEIDRLIGRAGALGIAGDLGRTGAAGTRDDETVEIIARIRTNGFASDLKEVVGTPVDVPVVPLAAAIHAA